MNDGVELARTEVLLIRDLRAFLSMQDDYRPLRFAKEIKELAKRMNDHAKEIEKRYGTDE